MKPSLLFCAVGALSLSATAFAEGVSYSYGELGVGDVELQQDVDGQVWYVTGSVEIDDLLFGEVSYERSDYDADFRQTITSVGMGARYSLQPSTDVFGVLSYLAVRNKLPNDSDNGGAIRLGLRHRVLDRFEFEFSANAAKLDNDDNVGATLAGRFFVFDDAALSLSYRYDSQEETERKGYFLSIRREY